MTTPTLYMAVDPAIAKPCWIAERVLQSMVWMTNLELHIRQKMWGLALAIDDDRPVDKYYIPGGELVTETNMDDIRIVALIEKPTVGKRSYGLAMIFAANAVAEAIKRIAPNPKGNSKNTWRNRIYFVDPHVWQKAMLTGAPGKNTKEQSCYVATGLTDHQVIDDNEADAICLYAYAESLGWEL